MSHLNQTIKLALVDDHKLFRKGLKSLIDMLGPQYTVIFEADNGKDLQTKLTAENTPDILLLDINMPEMDGFSTVKWINIHYPLIKTLVVSMIEKEETVINMLKLGIKGYLCKDVEPKELSEALHSVYNKGFYYTDFITGKLLYSIQQETGKNGYNGGGGSTVFNEREREFLKLVCSELTYNDIAGKMSLSPKTIDGYRNALFEKLNIKSRVGLALYAVKNGLVQL
jgi:two-component system invasion response regulator UvrY